MTTTMQAAVYYGPKDIRIETRPVPSPGKNEVLVRVLRAGICGTDAAEWTKGPKVFPVETAHPITGHLGPIIPGHEFAGEIVSAEVDSEYSPGDLVVSGAGIWCGSCPPCLEGRTNMCREYHTLGLNCDGGLAEYLTVPTSTLRRIPSAMSLSHAALAQPLAVGIHAARRARARTGDSVVIIGAGAIGTFVLAGLRHLASVDITVIDFPGEKLDRTLRLGADRVLPADQADPDEVIRALGRNPEVVIEASGAPGQLGRALQMVERGGRILAVGIPGTPPELDVHTMIFSEITLDTTLAHICNEDLDTALEILAEGTLGSELSEKVFSLTDLDSGLDRLASGQVLGKLLFDPSI